MLSSKQVNFTKEEVSLHDSADSAWVVHSGHVYDVTEFLVKHPGGADIILPHLGQRIDEALSDETSHAHSKAAFSLLETYRIGTLTSCNNNEHKNSNGHAVTEKSLNLNGWKEDRVDWSQAMLPQVCRLGKDYKTWVHSPVDYKLRLFHSGFVEFFSKTPWYVIPIIWAPVAFLSLVVSWQTFNTDKVLDNILPVGWPTAPFTLVAMTISLCFGILVWTFIEYILHRFLFHLDPKGDSPFLITLHFFLHGQHHKVPFDGDRLVFPPVAASFFAFLLYWIFTSIFSLAVGQSVFAGGVAGYIMYDLTHYYLHHGSPAPGTYLYRLKQYHIAHHFEDQAHGFGISSKLWDYPFNTTFKQKVS